MDYKADSFKASLILILLVIPSLVFAAEEQGAVLADFLAGTVFPVIGALLLGLVGVLLDKLRKKFNLQISAEAEARLMSYAEQGIALAEEKASEAIKRGVTKYTGREKLDTAIAYVMSHPPRLPRLKPRRL